MGSVPGLMEEAIAGCARRNSNRKVLGVAAHAQNPRRAGVDFERARPRRGPSGWNFDVRSQLWPRDGCLRWADPFIGAQNEPSFRRKTFTAVLCGISLGSADLDCVKL